MGITEGDWDELLSSVFWQSDSRSTLWRRDFSQSKLHSWIYSVCTALISSYKLHKLMLAVMMSSTSVWCLLMWQQMLCAHWSEHHMPFEYFYVKNINNIMIYCVTMLDPEACNSKETRLLQNIKFNKINSFHSERNFMMMKCFFFSLFDFGASGLLYESAESSLCHSHYERTEVKSHITTYISRMSIPSGRRAQVHEST